MLAATANYNHISCIRKLRFPGFAKKKSVIEKTPPEPAKYGTLWR
jgi:hypothetical protein